MQNRIISADLIRILAIYLIIIIHLKLPDYSDPRYPEGLIITPLINVCVPLFVMLSGALLLGKSESNTYFFKKRIAKVVFPWILWTFIFTLIVIINNHYSFSSFFGIFHSIFIPMFWIMPMVTGLYLLTPSLRVYLKYARQQDVWLIILFWYIGVSILPYFRNTLGFPMATDNGIVRLIISFLGYFIMGYTITKLKPSKKYIKLCTFLFILGLFLSYIVYAGIFRSSTVNTLSPGTVLLSASTFSIFYFSEKKLRSKLNNNWRGIIAKLSEATLGVFFIHFLFLNYPRFPIILRGNEFQIYVWLNPFLNGLLIYALSVCIILLLQKIPIFGKYVS